MIYLDNGATSFYKPPAVYRAVRRAMMTCANPGRGGYHAAMEASRQVYSCREEASTLFHCRPEQVVLTTSCTHGLNIAIRSLIKPGGKVVISGFEHNAVTRPLYALGVRPRIAGRVLFDWENTLEEFDRALRDADAAVFTHVSNVFGYILPIEKMANLCRQRRVPFIIDAAQSAGTLELNLDKLGAEFIAMPGHKGLLGPQGTGLLLCAGNTEPLLYGGTGSVSKSPEMPEDLPERLEPGTLNVPGIAGLREGLRYLNHVGVNSVFQREHTQLLRCIRGLEQLGIRCFSGDHQAGTVSILPEEDCEDTAAMLARQGIAVRGGFHCAPLAHESAGTLETGTVRISFGFNASNAQTDGFLHAVSKLLPRQK